MNAHNIYNELTIGVFKGRLARHLPWAPPFQGLPLKVFCVLIFFIFGEKLIIHSHNIL